MLMADVELPANTRETVRSKTFHEPVVCASECQNIRIHVKRLRIILYYYYVRHEYIIISSKINDFIIFENVKYTNGVHHCGGNL